MTDQVSFGEGLHPQGCRAQQAVEHLAVDDDVIEELLDDKGQSVCLHRPNTQLLDESRDVDFPRTDLRAAAASDAQLVKLFEIRHSA